jgi:hypothetical protein
MDWQIEVQEIFSRGGMSERGQGARQDPISWSKLAGGGYVCRRCAMAQDLLLGNPLY